MRTDIIVIMNSPQAETAQGIGDRAAGRALRARAQGRHTDKLGQALAALDPELLEYADGFIFGSVWTGPELGFEDRMLVAVTALAATGQTAQLGNYLHGALQDGIPPERIKEALKMLVVYVGFPTAISALATFDAIAAKYTAPEG
jgi:4-carboxymuconolactone decarboxylase